MINFINTVSSDYKSYETSARELTDLKKKNIPLPNGSYGQELNLDHTIPIKFGYDHNIPVSVICRDDNLQWITREDNLRKGSKLTEKATDLLKLWYDNGIIDTLIGSESTTSDVIEYDLSSIFTELKNQPISVRTNVPAEIAQSWAAVWCQRNETLRWEKTKRAIGHVALPTHAIMQVAVYPDGKIERLDGNTRTHIFNNNLQFPDYAKPQDWTVLFYSVNDKEEAERLYHSIDSSDTAETFSEKLSGYLRYKNYHSSLPVVFQKGEKVYDIAVVAVDQYVPVGEHEPINLAGFNSNDMQEKAIKTTEVLDYFIEEFVTLGNIISRDNVPKTLTSPLMGMLIRYLMTTKGEQRNKVMEGVYTLVNYLKTGYFPFTRPMTSTLKYPSMINLFIMMDELQTSDSIHHTTNPHLNNMWTSRRIIPEGATKTSKNKVDRALYCGWIAYCFDKYLADEVIDEDIVYDVTGTKLDTNSPLHLFDMTTSTARNTIARKYESFWDRNI